MYHSFIHSLVHCVCTEYLLWAWHSFFHSAHIDGLLVAKHLVLSCVIAGHRTGRGSDFMELSFVFLKSLPHRDAGSSPCPMERGCYFHVYFKNSTLRAEGDE